MVEVDIIHGFGHQPQHGQGEQRGQLQYGRRVMVMLAVMLVMLVMLVVAIVMLLMLLMLGRLPGTEERG